MSCGDHGKMNPVVHALYHVKEWDKKMAKKLQDKFGLTDYQMKCIAFAKGFIIGAILLYPSLGFIVPRVYAFPEGLFKGE